MDASRRRIVFASLVGTTLVAAVGAQTVENPILGKPVPAAAEDSQGTEPLTKETPAAAMAAAQASDKRVEDLSRADPYSAVYAEPDGTWTVESSPEPVRAKNATGDWAPIDINLVERDGRLRPKNVPGKLSLSTGEDQAFAKMLPDAAADTDAGVMTWQWPADLPTPVVDGATATYADVIPNGDLVVTATATGFTHNILLNEPPAPGAAPIELAVPITTPGAEIRESANGALVVKSTDAGHETIAAAPAPIMWDASGDPVATGTGTGTGSNGPEDPTVAPVDLAVADTTAGAQVTLRPDMSFLTDPDTVYPVTIDPSVTTAATADTWIMNVGYTSAQSTSAELRAGTYDNGAHLARTYMKFPSSELWQGNEIRGASLSLRNFSSTSCDGGAVRALRITESWSSTGITWDHQPAVTSAGYGQYSTAHGYGTSCPQADANFTPMGDIVRAWNNGAPNYGVSLRAYNEANPNSWRRYRSTEYATESYHPVLAVTYNTPPDVPAQVHMAPVTNGVATTTPTLLTRVSDPDLTNNLTAEFAIYQGSTHVWTGNSPSTETNEFAETVVPADVLTDGVTYSVKSRTSDGTRTSEWTPSRTFEARRPSTSSVVQALAPELHFYPGEPYGPMSAATFIDHSDLHWAHDGLCSDDRKDSNYSPNPTALGDGAYDHRVKSGAPYCDHEGRWWDTNEGTRPREPGGPTGAEGWYLKLEKAYEDGQGIGGGEPVYYQAVAGRYIVYYFHYGKSRTLKAWSHQGDWERIAVRLNSNNEPVEVEYFQHYKSCTEAWSVAQKSYGRPVIWVAKTAHGSYPRGGDPHSGDQLSGNGKTWHTKRNVRRLVDQNWFGYGGGWGEVGNQGHTTGPDGPPFTKTPEFKADRCD